MRTNTFRVTYLLVAAGLTTSCATVDQYGSRAYDGNVNTQNAINQEVLLNIIRASRYQALSWNPASQITGGQTEALTTGFPTINASGPAMFSNSLASGVSGGFTTAPLSTTSFQAGMLTPVDLKTIASLGTYYPREVIFFALISAINVRLDSDSTRHARLVNDPAQAYADDQHPNNLDQKACVKEMFDPRHPENVLFGENCTYPKFVNLLRLFIHFGLYTELVQILGQQPAQAQANQSNIVTIGRFCFNKDLVPGNLSAKGSNFSPCGQSKEINNGGTVATVRTEVHKADDVSIRTDTKSVTTQIIKTSASILPITAGEFSVPFDGVGRVSISFELRSPNGFLSYLGSWYNNADKIAFDRYEPTEKKRVLTYDSNPARQIFGTGPYISVTPGTADSCYTSVIYEGKIYCVPDGATHTTMLMDIAVILRNLSILPTDLNAPVSVRVAN